jgi:TBC1 domain family member 25
MSDMASPILFVMGSESHAYIAFSALMERLKDNFTTTGAAMTLKFEHLAAALNYHDQEFFSYLERHNVTSLRCIYDFECN